MIWDLREKKGLTVIDKEYTTIGVDPFFPALGERAELVEVAPRRCGRGVVAGHGAGATRPGINPGRRAFVVIDEEHSSIGSELHAPSWR